MSTELRAQKRHLRKTIIHRLGEFPDHRAAEASNIIGKKLFSRPAWEEAKRVYCFISMKHEIETGLILQEALKSGKRLAVPRMAGDDIVFHEIESLEGPFVQHAYGVYEPVHTLPLMVPSRREEDLVVSPGAAFTPSGLRLGYGKGFYDRFYSSHRGSYYSIGICFSFQVVKELPAGPQDIPVDEVITELEQYATGKSGGFAVSPQRQRRSPEAPPD